MTTTMSSEKILHIGCFADPAPVGSNRLLAAQVLALQQAGVVGEIMTLAGDGHWRGPVPNGQASRLRDIPYLSVSRGDCNYHVFDLPAVWKDRVMTAAEWEAAVDWGKEVLSQIGPSLVHQHYWQSTRFMLDAAQRLGIPTVCSVYDYGAACLRTLLVTGEGRLCDAVVGEDKCSKCIVAGYGALGKANEAVLRWGPARALVSRYGFGADLKGPLARRGAARLPVRERVSLTIERSRKELGRLNALIVTSPFSREFYGQFGIPPERIHVLPWFYTGAPADPRLPGFEGGLRLAFVGRLAAEKGLDVLLAALARVEARGAVSLSIAGAIDSPYAKELQSRYPDHAGQNRVTWAGWIGNDQVSGFYQQSHVAVIPSLWYDNTPAALVEALASGRPAICTDVPSMTHLVKHEINGLTFPMGDVGALSAAISRLADSPELVTRFARHTRNVPSVDEYAASIHQIYKVALL
ncbi:MAG: glycosyl transferase group 1 [Phycisphaerales bacterium]|nr:glycosyl transferase group 1 [Phycisphaerales bacterium]